MTDLRDFRKRHGLTQAEAAAKIGVTRRTWINRETGKTPIDTEAAMLLTYIDRFGWLDQD